MSAARIYAGDLERALDREHAARPRDAVNIRSPVAVIERFKSVCQSERRTYSEMLELMMIACMGAPGPRNSG